MLIEWGQTTSINMLNKESTLFRSILSFSLLLWCLYEIQLNSCNSNSCNSKDHLNRTNSLVPLEFTSKLLQESSFNSNSHNSKNHLNRTNCWVPWTYFSSCNSNFGFGVCFFHPSTFCCSKFECFNLNAIIFQCFEIFEFDCWWQTR